MNNMKLGYKAEKVYGVMLSEITSGILKAGERLPTEQELCERFGVSRNTLRSVLQKLYDSGRVIHKKNAGAYVFESGIFSNVVSLMCHGNLDLIIWVQNMLLERNYILNIFSQKTVGWSSESEAHFLSKLLHTPPKALLASCTPLPPSNDALLERLAEAGTRIIHFEPYSAESVPNQEYLLPDYRQAGYAAVTSLLAKGCRSILFTGFRFTGNIPPYYQLIKSGSMECLQEQNFTESSFFEQDVEILLKDKVFFEKLSASSNGPVGIFMVSYESAVKLKSTLVQMGYDIPGRIKIITVKLLGDENVKDITYIDFDRKKQLYEIVSKLDDSMTVIRGYTKPRVIDAG